jgi:S1-C subfamily serine protease
MYTVTTGNIASLGGLLGIVMTAAVNPGASGGVVVNSRGQVLGTIVAGYDQTELNDVAYFLPVANLWQLMAKLPEKKVSSKE